MAGLTLKERVGSNEATRLLCVEPSRFRFLEMQCEDFLSMSSLEYPRLYNRGDLKILAAAKYLSDEGLAPSLLKSRLSKMLAEPTGWNIKKKATRAEAPVVAPRLITVASGKGGVGKSNISLSLGVQLVSSGLRVALLDADLGVANAHLLAGLKVGRTLKDVIAGNCGIDDVIARVNGGLDVVPGSSGIYEMANISAPRRLALLTELGKLASRYDVVLVDAAAGVSGAVLDFVVAADYNIVVMTAETPAITDAYALIKLTYERNPYSRIGIVVNRVRSAREGAAAVERLTRCARKFLGRSPMELGCVWEDGRVRRAVNERVPFVFAYPEARASASIRKLSALLQEKKIVSRRPEAEEAAHDTSTESTTR